MHGLAWRANFAACHVAVSASREGGPWFLVQSTARAVRGACMRRLARVWEVARRRGRCFLCTHRGVFVAFRKSSYGCALVGRWKYTGSGAGWGRGRKGPQIRVGLASWNAHSQEGWACCVPVAAHAAGGSSMQARSSRAASPGSFARMMLPCTCAMRRTVVWSKSTCSEVAHVWGAAQVPCLQGVQTPPRSGGVRSRA